MNCDIEEAIKVTEECCEKICENIDHFADIEKKDAESMEKSHWLYLLAAELQVEVSQLTDCTNIYEGACMVNNARATVQIYPLQMD